MRKYYARYVLGFDYMDERITKNTFYKLLKMYLVENNKDHSLKNMNEIVDLMVITNKSIYIQDDATNFNLVVIENR